MYLLKRLSRASRPYSQFSTPLTIYVQRVATIFAHQRSSQPAELLHTILQEMLNVNVKTKRFGKRCYYSQKLIIFSAKSGKWSSLMRCILLDHSCVRLLIQHRMTDSFLFTQIHAWKISASWLTTPGPVFLSRFVRASKIEPINDEVELLEANPNFAQICYPDGRESTFALKDLAPCPSSSQVRQNPPCNLINTENINPSSSIEENRLNNETTRVSEPPPVHPLTPIRKSHISLPEPLSAVTDERSVPLSPTPLPRRCSRLRRAPDRYGDRVQ